MAVNILGLSAYYHDSSCCLLKDGVLTVAVQEERFSRIKHDRSLPRHAFRYCLQEGGLSIKDIDCIAYYENPEKKLARQLWSGNTYVREIMDPGRPEREIREVLGYEGPIKSFEHHLSHAASSFYYSGFNEAAILTVDGVGEWSTTTYGIGSGGKIELFEEVNFPDSLGLLYSTITSYLGFRVNNGEYKVMGLAPYGEAIYIDKMKKLLESKEQGQFRLNLEYFDFVNGKRMYSEKFMELFGQPPRKPETEILQFHKNIARSLQVLLEEVLLEKVDYLHEKTGKDNLCMAGGVALNCVANEKILREGPFKRLFVQPAAGDGGCSLGAAALAYIDTTGKHLNAPLEHVFLGPGFSNTEITRLLDSTALKYKNFQNNTRDMVSAVAQLLSEGKVIGWFQGKMEFGPRALGARSILADPRDPGMRDKINSMVKKREAFRPFAPAVIEEESSKHFKIDHPSPYMLETCQVISSLDLPAITHTDNSARIQTVSRQTNRVFYDLIVEFNKITGCPMLLNTSFNVRGQPIVCTPFDAVICFLTTEIDYLVLGDYLIDRPVKSIEALKASIAKLRSVNIEQSNIGYDVYTFI